MLGTTVSLPAPAASTDVFRPFLGYSYSYDDNVLRLKNGAVSEAVTGTSELSDSSHRAEGGLLFEKQIGQQTLLADVKLSRTRYSRLEKLDHDSKDLLAKWNWHLGNHLQGNLGTSYTKTLTQFVDFHRLEPNLRSQHRQFIDAAWRLHPSWRLRGGFTHYELEYELPSELPKNRDEDSTEFGLDYLPSSTSSVGLQLRQVQGRFPNREQRGSLLVDNSFDQNEVMAKIDWAVTGKTRLQFLGGHVEREHRFFPTRDYSGYNARTIATWTPTGKTALVMSAWRETGSYHDLTTSYTINRGISLVPTWNLTSKIKFDGILRYEKRDFGRSQVIADEGAADRKDTFHYSSVGLTYLPLPALQVRVSVFRDRQNSSSVTNGYRANGASISAKYAF